MVINGLPAATRLPASPPIGLHGDKTILIHMLGYEDWTPRSPNGSTSRTSSGHGSSAPTIARFDWVEGVIDGRPVQTWRVRPEACHGLPERQEPRTRTTTATTTTFACRLAAATFPGAPGPDNSSPTARQSARSGSAPVRRRATTGGCTMTSCRWSGAA